MQASHTVLVDFWAPWCPHCRKINPAYEQIATEYAASLDVVKVDMDEDDGLWEALSVELIPTLRLYVEGKPAGDIVAPESKAAIEAFLAGVLPQRRQEAEERIYDMIVIGGGPGDIRRRCMRPGQGCKRWCWKGSPPADRWP